MKLGKASPPFCMSGWLDNIKTNKYAEFDQNISYGPRVMKILLTDHNRLDNGLAMPCGFAYHWLGNVDMHMYANHVVQK